MALACIGKCYLLLYNGVLFFGWLYILLKTLVAQINTPEQLYPAISFELKIFQTAALLEIVHSAIGLVRSPVFTTALQVFSRIMLVWPVVHSVPEAQKSTGILLFTIAWSVTEVIRYSFYFFSLLNRVPYFLLWARYTLFIVLYPLGVVGEIMTVVSALPAVKARKIYSVELPNASNISFNYHYALCGFMLLYLPYFPQLYLYMFGQRKKYLSTEMKKKKE